MATSDSPLNVPDVTLAVAVEAQSGGGTAGAGAVEPSAEYFSDDFSSGDWNKPRPGDGANFWVSNSFGSVVTMSPDGWPTVIYNGSSTYNELVEDSRDWTAKEGDNCLRVRYNANSTDNAIQQWKIQESDAMTEIHMAFWLRVPVNFRKAGENNKLIIMWMDGRSQNGVGSTVGMEYRGTDSAEWYVKVGAGDNTVVGSDQGNAPWITYPDDQGRWMRIVFAAKAESAPEASDGWVKVWRRWEDMDYFENTHNIQNQPIKLPDDPASPQGFVECEILGWPNGPFAEDTEFLLDDLRISATPLVPAGTEGVGGTPVDVTVPEADLVVDTFESADFSAPTGPAPSKNVAGFYWHNLQRISIVNDSDYVVHDGTNTISNGPYPDRLWENGPGFSGSHSMRFRYQAGSEMTEGSFGLGQYYTELWVRRWVRVPINYYHGSLNNKWFSIFPTRTRYDEKGTLTVQTRPDGSDGSAQVVYQDGGVTSGETGWTPYISVPADRGRWMQIVYRVKQASSPTANDGIFQHWRRWADESAFTLIHSKTNAQLYNEIDPNGFKEGYVFGWANDPYTENTEFLMDDFELSTQPLVPAGTEGL